MLLGVMYPCIMPRSVMYHVIHDMYHSMLRHVVSNIVVVGQPKDTAKLAFGRLGKLGKFIWKIRKIRKAHLED